MCGMQTCYLYVDSWVLLQTEPCALSLAIDMVFELTG